MIDSFYIYSKATEMVKQTGTRNPMKIASEIGVMLRYSEELDKLLGLYTYRWKHRIILLNDKMEEIMARMVCAHELGHDALHRDIAKGEGLKEFVLQELNKLGDDFRVPCEADSLFFRKPKTLTSNELN